VDLGTVTPRADANRARSGRFEQRSRVLTRRAVGFTSTKHPNQLADDAVPAQQLDAGSCRRH
jgi:hypothetical protein